MSECVALDDLTLTALRAGNKKKSRKIKRTPRKCEGVGKRNRRAVLCASGESPRQSPRSCCRGDKIPWRRCCLRSASWTVTKSRGHAVLVRVASELLVLSVRSHIPGIHVLGEALGEAPHARHAPLYPRDCRMLLKSPSPPSGPPVPCRARLAGTLCGSLPRLAFPRRLPLVYRHLARMLELLSTHTTLQGTSEDIAPPNSLPSRVCCCSIETHMPACPLLASVHTLARFRRAAGKREGLCLRRPAPKHVQGGKGPREARRHASQMLIAASACCRAQAGPGYVFMALPHTRRRQMHRLSSASAAESEREKGRGRCVYGPRCGLLGPRCQPGIAELLISC